MEQHRALLPLPFRLVISIIWVGNEGKVLVPTGKTQGTKQHKHWQLY